MIKFTASNKNGRRTVGLGLTEGNWRNLCAGKPIHIHLEELGLSYPVEILIMGSQTDETLIQSLRDEGIELPESLEWRGSKDH